MATTSSQNRRKYARLDIALTVGYAVEDVSGEISEYAEAISSDISAGGLRLMTPSALEIGSRLDLEIFLGDEPENKVHAKGEVMWQNKISNTSFETGIFMSHMDLEDKKKLLGFVFDQMSRLVGFQK